MDSTMYVYKPYPRRLYLNGEVVPGDLHALNSVVVEDEAGEAAARAKGYRKAYEVEPIEKQPEEGGDDSGGNGGSHSEAQAPSSAPVQVAQDQGGAAATSADPVTAPAERKKPGPKPKGGK